MLPSSRTVVTISDSCTVADIDEASKQEIKTLLLQYDRTLLVSDPRRCEPKKCVSLCLYAAACMACSIFSSSIYAKGSWVHFSFSRRFSTAKSHNIRTDTDPMPYV